MLESRVEKLNGLQGKFRLLQPAEVAKMTELLGARLVGVEKGHYVLVDQMDASDANREEVLAWLRGISIPDDVVKACWVTDREGVEIERDAFFEHYDELALPGADDVWVSNPELRWVLELSHEETLSYFEIRP